MSYDLNFWKYSEDVVLDHQDTYEKLSDGQAVEGLQDLPIKKLLSRVKDVFSSWEQIDGATWEGVDGTFQVFTTPQFFRVDCYGMSDEDMNKLIEIAAGFNCPLYDPQVGQRFDASA